MRSSRRRLNPQLRLEDRAAQNARHNKSVVPGGFKH
jgi:hypothetical protein